MTDSIQAHEVPQVTANLVPMHIQYSGTANTHKYFTPSRATEKFGEQDVDVAYFRGTRLIGTEATLGEYTGYVSNFSESLAQGEDGEVKTVRTLTPVAQFKGINIFGHDGPAESGTEWALLGEWSEISHVLHD